jgi:hypothetical protein
MAIEQSIVFRPLNDGAGAGRIRAITKGPKDKMGAQGGDPKLGKV